MLFILMLSLAEVPIFCKQKSPFASLTRTRSGLFTFAKICQDKKILCQVPRQVPEVKISYSNEWPGIPWPSWWSKITNTWHEASKPWTDWFRTSGKNCEMLILKKILIPNFQLQPKSSRGGGGRGGRGPRRGWRVSFKMLECLHSRLIFNFLLV